MKSKFSRRQLQTVLLVPLAILVLGALAYEVLGPVALMLPIVLVGTFIAYLLVELRHFQLGLFHRQKEELIAQFTQMEALLGITWTLDPALPLPGTRGWAASPDLLRELVQQVYMDPPQLVLEASSGTSTLVIAYAMERMGQGRVIALEHDAGYAEKTRRSIAAHGLTHRASVIFAPLVVQRIASSSYRWYDLKDLELPGTIDLLIVDGPPDTTQPMARYPAVPLLIDRFSKDARVILDDGARPDERNTAERWSTENRNCSKEYLPLEKGAWFLRFGGVPKA